MKKRTWMRLTAVVLAFGLLAAACGDDEDDAAPDAGTAPATTAAPSDEAPAAEEPDAPAADDDEAPAPTTTAVPVVEGELAGVCPSPMVVQTDWFPESEHGAMYELVGDDYIVDVDNKVVRGSMVLGGTNLGIEWEVRTGGPAIGFSPVSQHMAADSSIHLGYASTDQQINHWDVAPLVSVVAPLERNPQMVMWDPETYPDVTGLADLGERGITVNVFGGGTFPEVFVAQGIWSADQVDPSYDGSPSRFVSEGGSIAQQGFASSEVYTYEHVYEQWGKPVAFQLLHDAGFQIYSQTIGVRPGDMESLRPCLEKLVPIIQQAVVDFDADPSRANAIIVDAVDRYQDFWVYPPDLAEFSHQAKREFGLIGNGPDNTVGNLVGERIAKVLDDMRAAGMDIDSSLTAEQLYTNEFIDPNISLPYADIDAPETMAVDLSGVCPSPLVVQTDWFPESEHGAMYELLGDDYTVDVDNKVVRGSMVLGGEDLGIEWEVRTGGPAIGFSPVSQHMAADSSIHMGYASTDQQVNHWDVAPLIAVVAPLERNPQMVMWDPETYPNVTGIADLGAEGITVNVFGGGTFPEVFVAQGIWSADQVDPSYDGSPSRFVSEGGAIAQQGFASSEVYTYEFVYEQWGKPVAFELLHDAGFQIYSQTIGIRPSDLEELRPCLEHLVPIIQQAAVDFIADPDRANAIIVDAVEKYQDFWVYPPDLADFSVQAQIDYGLVGNGPDDIVGNMVGERIAKVLDDMRAAGMDIDPDLTADQMFTNEFIDESIGF